MKKIADISLKAKDKSAIQKAVALLKRDFPVLEAILFGSKVRGDDDVESDIDLLVLTSKKLSWQERNKMTDGLYDIQLKYNVVFSLLVLPAKEWKKGIVVAHPIHQTIEEEGIAA